MYLRVSIFVSHLKYGILAIGIIGAYLKVKNRNVVVTEKPNIRIQYINVFCSANRSTTSIRKHK